MNVAVSALDRVVDASRESRRDERLLGYAIAGSVLLHTLIVALAPGFRKEQPTALPPLEVVIAPPIPQPVKVEPPPKPRPPPPVQKPVVKPQPQRKPPPVQQAAPPQRAPVLSLPATTPVVPAYTVPQVQPEPAPEPKVAEAPATPAAKPAAAAPAAPAAKEAPVTPPVFNAAYLGNAPPRYPMIARRSGVEGTVYLKVLVGKDGRPSQVNVDKSSGSSPLDNAALEAVRGWKFAPARRGQEPVEQSVVVPIVFKLEGAS